MTKSSLVYIRCHIKPGKHQNYMFRIWKHSHLHLHIYLATCTRSGEAIDLPYRQINHIIYRFTVYRFTVYRFTVQIDSPYRQICRIQIDLPCKGRFTVQIELPYRQIYRIILFRITLESATPACLIIFLSEQG